MQEKREVWMTITSLIGAERVQQNVRASVYYKEGKTFFHYPEPDPSMGNTRTTLRVERDSVRILRQGDYRMEQTFQAGRRTAGTYETPHGRMELDAETIRLENRLIGGIGRVEWAYDLFVSGELSGNYTLIIESKEAAPA